MKKGVIFKFLEYFNYRNKSEKSSFFTSVGHARFGLCILDCLHEDREDHLVLILKEDCE